MIDTTTASTDRLIFSDLLDWLEAADVADGGDTTWRLKSLMWSLLTSQVSPAAALAAIRERDLDRLDDLIFDDGV